jgi:hypothetical protein
MCPELSQIPISDRYRLAPLFKKFDGMPISEFLQQMQSVADSPGYSLQAEVKK